MSDVNTDLQPIQPEPQPLWRRTGSYLLDVLSGYGLACLLLIGLMILTYFGTYAQKSVGLVRAQQIYFDSFWTQLEFSAFGFPNLRMWFPGAFLLLSILLCNLVLGGIIRIKWSRRTIGVLIGHFGIVLLLVAGFVKYTQSTNGALQLEPDGRAKSTYVSFHEWEMVIGEPRGSGKVREHIVPDFDLETCGVFVSEALPFRVVVEKYLPNSVPAEARTSLASNVVDGLYLEPRPRSDKAPMNVPGVYVVVEAPGEKPQRGLLWGLQNHPWTVEVNGVPWTVDLRKRVFDLPFELRLEQFRKEEHPGVMTPRHFSSDVVKIKDGVEQKFHIAMNEPMRYGGFMFSQNNWGPQDGSPPPYYTVLEVSSNPSDQWPKYACFIIAFGLLIHFASKLWKHVARMNFKREAI